MTDYLVEYDQAAAPDKSKLVRKWIDSETLPFFKELRAKRPVLETPLGTLVARFSDVREVLAQPKVFTTQLYVPKQSNGLYLMSHDDDALHTREKSIMQGLLNRDDLPAVRVLVSELCNEILNGAKNHRIEAAYDYCRSVPAGMVQNYFGLTGVEREKLIKWSYWAQYDTFHNQPFDLRSDAEHTRIHAENERGSKELADYITELIAHRLLMAKLSAPFHYVARAVGRLFGNSKSLTDDVVTRMLRTDFPGEVDFDIQRVGVNASGLLIGAVETTARAVALVVQYLLGKPESFERAKEAARLADTARFDGFVWEALRFVSPFPYTFRQCEIETTIARGTEYATTVRPGTYVLALTQSAMFDEHAFNDPEAFNPTRNWYHYFHFGFGSHECLGKYVGMVMIPEMVRQLFLRSNLKANAPIDYKGGPFAEHYELSWSG